MYENKTKLTLLSGVGKLTWLFHSLSNDKISSHMSIYPMVLWGKLILSMFFK